MKIKRYTLIDYVKNYFRNSFFRELKKEIEKSPSNKTEIIALIVKEYNKANAVFLDALNLSHSDMVNLCRWLYVNQSEALLLSNIKTRIGSTLIPRLPINITDKINILSQYQCPICQKYQTLTNFPIQIKPQSYQVIKNDKKKHELYRKKVTNYLKSTKIDYRNAKSMCVHITFVLGTKEKEKDLDNMSKFILDLIKKIIIPDDSKIVHLSSIKLRSNSSVSYLYFTMKETTLTDHSDVLFPVWDAVKTKSLVLK